MDIKLVQTSRDISELARLGADIWQQHYVTIISNEQIAYMLDKFQSVQAITEQIEKEGYEYYFLIANGEKIGYIGTKQEEGKLFLSKCYIEKSHRGKGYASQAFAFLETLCQKSSLTKIWLTVNRHNKDSIAVYEKKGFQKVRTQIADIGNGYVMDDYIMEKELVDH
ncbi:GNAT family acetyltransferase [Niallia circulans]|uniref:GNAT family N-acetyltransferase n=1 Tax=Shouchella clausii TaxID=79880 RepID=UPI000B9645B0|nr:GNAT family N-acetyltransferase [Shouchella clausii]SPU18245.1 GNAT family acetyltransferase [Niallia circulans]MCM3547860.1 GNAT family N-acetyltransferase [Shouchella clausii]MCR1288036.1 GNAT family N-acetyltransferase [Shouchella clausii]MEB5472099.1 GNAT family N-acetyltransferase [Shouchella clausii]PAF15398.1 GNAT family N-acetyltransferase [Shouchella clausii]